MTNLNFNFLLKEIPKVLKDNGLKRWAMRVKEHPESGRYLTFTIMPDKPVRYPVTVNIWNGYVVDNDGDYCVVMYNQRHFFSHESHDRMAKGSREILNDLNLMCQDLLHFSVNQREVLHYA